MNEPRAISIALLAMGGEGGGVLADWLVDLAEHEGFVAQATSVPGVAQRTGATLYYIEMFPRSAVPGGAQPVLALAPVPGEVDVVIASELMEAGRALQRGLVTPARTTLVTSTHRVYSMAERTALGDARVDADKLLQGAQAAAHRLVAADFAQVAERAGAPIAAALCGALAASGALPFGKQAFEETIRRGGVGVEASLRAFGAGFEAALDSRLRGNDTPPPTRLGPRLATLEQRIVTEFPTAVHEVLRAGVLRLADYQDPPYAAQLLDRLAPLRNAPSELLHETARHLALWMSYEDAIRVADLKTRRSRFERVASEVRLADAQLLEIGEFMHPRPQEIADILPESLGRWLLSSALARRVLEPATRKGKVVRTSTLRGYLLLYAIAALRPLRPRSLRFREEQQHIETWLAHVQRLAAAQPALALEVARAQRLVKGYGDTHARGWSSFERLMATLPRLENTADGGPRLRNLAQAALADDSGAALERELASL
ncbi:MAG TPA: indolepyruvate oxidoreductase subunit beta family protein [Ramlibacter sp.]|uniref:indolepyruvate oxidoreductase subunit beta family protein n=1 Tax=Ramlibacter sp. TaxID=1917967 RepID=UPI002D802517|nr:indolepyruvate oxidoreductase subunit beta family protein [Ramlibacter sp.]HET8744328.1 indolepyruvate oxidoreductase subunit beta family protein [Ramlibacter sp.]